MEDKQAIELMQGLIGITKEHFRNRSQSCNNIYNECGLKIG